MSVEIERKFLVDREKWIRDRKIESIEKIAQGYLSTEIDVTIRVRIKNDRGFLTIKGKSHGISRAEFEYEIPISDAESLLDLCKPIPIVKTRYIEIFAGYRWEVDEFDRENSGLILAEIELQSESEEFEKPPWILDEVSNDPRYFNSNLSKNPFNRWGEV